MNNYSLLLSLRKAIHDKLHKHCSIVKRQVLVFKGSISDVHSFFTFLGFKSSQFYVFHNSPDIYYISVKD